MKKSTMFVAAALVIAAPAQAQRGGAMPSFMTITPQGPVVNLTVSDSTEVAPDIAYVGIGVTSRNRDKALAMQENRRVMDKVIAALKASGVADKDIKTQWFSVNEDIEYAPTGTRRKKGYIVSNSLRVTVRKLDGLSELLATASASGATDVGSPDFDVEMKTPIIEKLTLSATEKARARAQFHSRLNGYTGIKLVSVSDEVVSSNQESGVFRLTMARPASDEAAAEAAPEIRPQQVTINVSLYMTFEMTK